MGVAKFRSFCCLVLFTCFIHVYGKESCPYCILADSFLSRCGAKIRFHDVQNVKERNKLTFLLEDLGLSFSTVPQIFICGTHIGGYGDMIAMYKNESLQGVFEKNKMPYKCK